MDPNNPTPTPPAGDDGSASAPDQGQAPAPQDGGVAPAPQDGGTTEPVAPTGGDVENPTAPPPAGPGPEPQAPPAESQPGSGDGSQPV